LLSAVGGTQRLTEPDAVHGPCTSLGLNMHSDHYFVLTIGEQIHASCLHVKHYATELGESSRV